MQYFFPESIKKRDEYKVVDIKLTIFIFRFRLFTIDALRIFLVQKHFDVKLDISEDHGKIPSGVNSFFLECLRP